MEIKNIQNSVFRILIHSRIHDIQIQLDCPMQSPTPLLTSWGLSLPKITAFLKTLIALVVPLHEINHHGLRFPPSGGSAILRM